MSAAKLGEWLARLEHRSAPKLGLERIARAVRRLKLVPAAPVIVVAGTNGKGSCCAFLEAVLSAAGYLTGCFYSPHLSDFRERIQIGRRPVPDADIVAAFAHVDSAADAVAGAQPLTYFEIAAAAAMRLFMRAGCEAIILEVGLGGRLDAVNAFDADVAVITSIGIDHIEHLGADRESIGLEKAGIMRRRRPVVCGDAEPPASVLRRAGQLEAPCLVRGRDFKIERASGRDVWRYRGAAMRDALPRPAMQGAHQFANAACALAALEQLAARLPVSQAQVRAGLLTARLPARFEVVPGAVPVVLDVAHNPQGAKALAAALLDMGYFAHTEAVFAARSRKDIAGIVANMARRVDSWRLAPLAGDQAGLAAARAAVRAGGGACTTHAAVGSAFAAAQAAAARQDRARVVVFGSFGTVEEYLRFVNARRAAA